MHCKDTESLIQEYLASECDASRREKLDEHLAACEKCRETIEDYERYASLLGDYFRRAAPSPDFKERVMANLPTMDFPRASVIRRRRKILLWSSLAAAVLICIVVSIFWRGEAPQKPPEPIGTITRVVELAPPVVSTDRPKVSPTAKRPEIQRKGEPAPIAAEKGMHIYKGDKLTTSAGSKIALSLIGSSIKLNISTVLEFQDARSLTLAKGEMWANVLEGGGLFKIATDNGDVTVKGTTFLVKTSPDETRVTTIDGLVNLANDKGEQDIGKGKQSVASKDAPPADPKDANIEEAAKWLSNLEPKRVDMKPMTITRAETGNGKFRIEGWFFLGDASDGIDLSTDDVFISMSTLAEAQIPAGFFEQTGRGGIFKYTSPTPGLRQVEFDLMQGRFSIGGDDLGLAGQLNPVEFTFKIGHDFDEELVRLERDVGFAEDGGE